MRLDTSLIILISAATLKKNRASSALIYQVAKIQKKVFTVVVWQPAQLPYKMGVWRHAVLFLICGISTGILTNTSL